MYKWYGASVTTLVLLASVDSPSALGDLTDSIWMTRAWTSQELLAPKVIRFYDRDRKPYLGDTRANHKESPKIMQELADAIAVSHKTLTAVNQSDIRPHNSCLPASLCVYTRTPRASDPIEGAEMEMRVAGSRNSLSENDAIPIYEHVVCLAPARFVNRRLYLPCTTFAVKRLGIQDIGSGQENRYRARVSGIGHV